MRVKLPSAYNVRGIGALARGLWGGRDARTRADDRRGTQQQPGETVSIRLTPAYALRVSIQDDRACACERRGDLRRLLTYRAPL